MFSYKAKNYALLTREGEVVIKGGALKSRGLEKFQRVFLEEMIKLLMEGKPEAIPALRDEFAQKIRDREWPIEMLMKTDTLQDSLEKYRQKISGGGRNKRRRLRTRPNERPQLQAGRPDQLLRKSDTEKSRRLRSRQARDRFRPAKPRRERRLLRRKAGRPGEEIRWSDRDNQFVCTAGKPRFVRVNNGSAVERSTIGLPRHDRQCDVLR